MREQLLHIKALTDRILVRSISQMARKLKSDPEVQEVIIALARLYSGLQTVAGVSALLTAA